MKFVLAFLSFGLFGFLGFAVLDDELGEGGSGKSRALKAAVSTLTDSIGPDNTAYALWGFGVALSGFFMWRN